jgi:hypothetical protein
MAEGSNTALKKNGEESGQKPDGDDSDDSEEDDSETEPANNGFKLYSKGEYSKNREKNIAELKLIVADLKKKHPLPEVPEPKPAVKKPAAKQKSDDKPVERRISMRNKGNQDKR